MHPINHIGSRESDFWTGVVSHDIRTPWRQYIHQVTTNFTEIYHLLINMFLELKTFTYPVKVYPNWWLFICLERLGHEKVDILSIDYEGCAFLKWLLCIIYDDWGEGRGKQFIFFFHGFQSRKAGRLQQDIGTSLVNDQKYRWLRRDFSPFIDKVDWI